MKSTTFVLVYLGIIFSMAFMVAPKKSHKEKSANQYSIDSTRTTYKK